MQENPEADPCYRGSTGLKCDPAVHHGIGIYGKLQLTWCPSCNGACVETRRARDREVLPRQHPITSKGNLLSSSSEETIRRWVGATFSGWDVGGHFATRKSRNVAHWLIAPTRWYALRKTSGAQRMSRQITPLAIELFPVASAKAFALVWLTIPAL